MSNKPCKLIGLRAENFMRLEAVNINPSDAVTRIVGENEAGKTSALDAITAALGGKAYSPVMPIRAGQETAVVVLDIQKPDGARIIVTRKWKFNKDGEITTSLAVTTPDGAKFGSAQTLLDDLIGEISFDPLRFERMKPVEQAAMLATIANIDISQFKEQKQLIAAEIKAAKNQIKNVETQLAALPPKDEKLPEKLYSVTEIAEELSEAETHNRGVLAERAAIDKLKDLAESESGNVTSIKARLEKARAEVTRIEGQLTAAEQARTTAEENFSLASLKGTAELIDVAPIQERIRKADGINDKIRQNQQRATIANHGNQLLADVTALEMKATALETLKNEKITAAELPIENISLTEDGVFINGIPFEQCSGAQRLTVSVAIGFALNPKLKLMLIRDGSLLDNKRMELLNDMAVKAEAQVLIERVDNGHEIGVMIVDGKTAVDDGGTMTAEAASAEPTTAA